MQEKGCSGFASLIKNLLVKTVFASYLKHSRPIFLNVSEFLSNSNLMFLMDMFLITKCILQEILQASFQTGIII